MENIKITEKHYTQYVLLAIEGSINSYTYMDFESKLYALAKEHTVVLDLSEVTNMSSSGLGVLMSALEDSQESGHTLYLLNPSDIVKTAIEATGFKDMFSVIRSVGDVF